MFFAGAAAIAGHENEARDKWRSKEYRIQVQSSSVFKESLCYRVAAAVFETIAAITRGVIREMHLAVAGLLGGFTSIGYIFLLLVLTMYIYAVLGNIWFVENDPWHWESLEKGIVTLTRVAILDYWTVILYVNYYGCYVFNGDYYAPSKDDVDHYGDDGAAIVCYKDAEDAMELGGAHHNPRPVLAVFFFISYIFLAGFCVLSLVIGTVSIAMFDAMGDLKEEDKHITEEGIANQMIGSGAKPRKMSRALAYLKLVMHGYRPDVADKRTLTLYKLLALAWTVGSLEEAQKRMKVHGWQRWYELLCDSSALLMEDENVQLFINVCIIYVSLLAGLDTISTFSRAYAPAKDAVEVAMTTIFTVECALKIIAEKEGHHLYFYDSWNILDFVVVLFSYMSFLPSNLVMLARMVRLLRLLKLVRMLPQLQSMTEAMMDGIKNTISIAVLLFVYLYVYALIGYELFRKNDPHRFGDTITGMITLFQIATCDAWADALYTNAYGCHVYGFNEWECNNPEPQFWVAVVYFISHLVFGGFVMLTLFVGIMSLSLEERAEGMVAAVESEKEIGIICIEHSISPQALNKYRAVFELVDISDNKSIEEIELSVAIEIAGVDRFRHMELWKAFKRRDEDKSIDFATFLHYTMLLRHERKIAEKGDSSKSILARDEVKLAKRKEFLLTSVEDDWDHFLTSPSKGKDFIPIDPNTGQPMSPMSPMSPLKIHSLSDGKNFFGGIDGEELHGGSSTSLGNGGRLTEMQRLLLYGDDDEALAAAAAEPAEDNEDETITPRDGGSMTSSSGGSAYSSSSSGSGSDMSSSSGSSGSSGDSSSGLSRDESTAVDTHASDDSHPERRDMGPASSSPRRDSRDDGQAHAAIPPPSAPHPLRSSSPAVEAKLKTKPRSAPVPSGPKVPRPPRAVRESTFIIIKPHACVEKVWHFVLYRLELCGLKVEHYGLFKTRKQANLDLLDRQYARTASAALVIPPAELHVSDDAIFAIRRSLQLDWNAAIAAGHVHNASDTMAALGIGVNKLGALWKSAVAQQQVAQIDDDVWIARLDNLPLGGLNGAKIPSDTFCINGDYPALRAEYTDAKSKCLVVEVSWEDDDAHHHVPGRQTWSSVIDNVIGPTDPTVASHHSIRGGVYQKWIELDMPMRPTTTHNVVHCAASALEAMAARSVWRQKTNATEDWNFDLFSDPLSARLLSAGIPAQTIKWWMTDPVIEGTSMFQRVKRMGIPATVTACVALYRSYSGDELHHHNIDLRRFYGATGEKKVHPGP